MKHSPAAVFARLSNPNPPSGTQVLLDTAVVLGGSFAGLLAARVLSDHATTVIVIDKDDPGASLESRPGAPQAAQVHSLLPGGLIQLERWFPGFTRQAVAAGARPAPPAARRFYFEGVPRAGGSPAMMLTATRPFFEAQIRQLTFSLPNVKAITARVTGLEFGAGAVTSVRYESDGQEGVERADFVVDAMGRSSRLSEWLAKAGWERPSVRRTQVDLNYATALLARADDGPEATAVVAFRAPGAADGVAGAVLSQVEGGRWLIGMAGYAGSRPGRTAADLVRRCKTEFPPEFGQVAGNEVLSIRAYRHAESMRRDFHAVTRMPARLVPIGDSVAAPNPVYGQGIASAALQVSCLSEYLRSDPDLSRPARTFFALQKVIVDAVWGMASGADLALPHINGPYPRGYRLLRWINGQVRPAAFLDPQIACLVEEVTWMLRHPSALAAPAALIRAIKASRRARKLRNRSAK